MDINKVDQRVKKTKDAIKQSFIHLLNSENIDKITINQICTLAKVNRITFYNHYHDKFDLFSKVLADRFKLLLSEYKELTSDLDHFDTHATYLTIFLKLYVKLCFTHRDFIFNLFTIQDSPILQSILRNSLDKLFYDGIKMHKLDYRLNIDLELFIPFMSGGAYSLINYIILSSSKHTEDDISEFITKVINKALEN